MYLLSCASVFTVVFCHVKTLQFPVESDKLTLFSADILTCHCRLITGEAHTLKLSYRNYVQCSAAVNRGISNKPLLASQNVCCEQELFNLTFFHVICL